MKPNLQSTLVIIDTTRFNIKNLGILDTQRVYVFHIIPSLNKDQLYNQHQLIWRCMHRASSHSVYMNQQDAQNSCD